MKIDRNAVRFEFDTFAIGDQVLVEQRPEFREAPAKLGARVIRSIPQELAQPVAQLRAAAPDEIRKERSRFLRRRQRDGLAVPLHLQLAEESDFDHGEGGSILRPRFEHQVERGFRRAAEALESTADNHVADPRLAGLSTEPQTHFLRT